MTSMFFSPSDWQSLTFRLAAALLVGGAIGLNRQQPGRPAGVRTFTIVSLGAAIFVMIPLQLEGDSSVSANASNALSRTVQGVATGVGFLGAGIILQQTQHRFGKAEVKGLTSAATIWLTAGLGAAAGCGLWQMSLVGTFFALMVLCGVKKLKKSGLSRLGAKNRLKKQVKDAAPTQDAQP